MMCYNHYAVLVASFSSKLSGMTAQCSEDLVSSVFTLRNSFQNRCFSEIQKWIWIETFLNLMALVKKDLDAETCANV